MSLSVGDQIQSSSGMWSGAPTSIDYQWQVSASGSSGWSDVTGATRSDYIIVSGDEGKYFRCVVVASNAVGSSSSQYTEAVGPVVGDSPPGGPSSGRVVLLSGVKSTTSDSADDVRDVDKGWSIY